MSIKKFKHFENKISNYNNIRQLAIEKFDSVYKRIEKRGYYFLLYDCNFSKLDIMKSGTSLNT